MTIDTLIDLLAEYRDQHGPDAEVRLMTQQNWPFENRVAGVTSGAEMNEASEDDPSEFFDDQDVAEDASTFSLPQSSTRLFWSRSNILRRKASRSNWSLSGRVASWLPRTSSNDAAKTLS